MGRNILGPEELLCLPAPFSFGTIEEVEVPFSPNVLERVASTHILIFGPRKFRDGTPITVNSLRYLFGIDPSFSEPCMYNQDWYLNEDFAKSVELDGKWHLMAKKAREDLRAKPPEAIKAMLNGEQFPTAVSCAFAFFAWSLHSRGERLWEHDYIWCSDHDHSGDRIYVGRYEDPDGINKNGFSIHRHLSLKATYSAAPEVAY